MKMQGFRLLPAMALFTLAVLSSRLFGGPQEDALETARLLAILLDSGRVTVAKHQDLINTPTQTDKKFTPELFEQEVLAEFQRQTGIALNPLEGATVPTMAKPLLAQLLRDSIGTIQSYQPVLSVPAVRYKGLIPATFGTETAARFQRFSQIHLKQTAPDHLVRNVKNKPDAYETAAFERFGGSSAASGKHQIISELVDGGRSARLMLPLYYEKTCLACHGEPKGERDISGYAREGGKEGDLGGAISVMIPLQ
jgi:Protein of unknown function (DUF3365)